MNKKERYGQFFTTNAEYICNNLLDIFSKDDTIIDPFVGNGDLLKLVKEYNIKGYDIDKKIKGCISRDTLKNPLDYKNKMIFTNPPYLARNKNNDKYLYDKYKLNDLYKIAIKTIMGCDGGILIIPINFFSGEDNKLRKEFLSNFKIIKMNIFEEQVFDDTSYTICSFSFKRSKQKIKQQKINIVFFPTMEKKTFYVSNDSDFKIGSEFYNYIDHNHNIKRLVVDKNIKPNSMLYLRAIDTGTEQGRISLTIKNKHFYAKSSDRTFATIVLEKELSLEKQEIISMKFNEILEFFRKKYNSLFLTNYRNSGKTYARKRISFIIAYGLINYIIKKYNF